MRVVFLVSCQATVGNGHIDIPTFQTVGNDHKSSRRAVSDRRLCAPSRRRLVGKDHKWVAIVHRASDRRPGMVFVFCSGVAVETVQSMGVPACQAR